MVNQYCAHSFARHWQLPFLNQPKGENDRRKYFMISLHKRMLLTSAGVEPATSWSPFGRRIQLSHRGRLSEEGERPQKWFHGLPLPVPTLFANVAGLGGSVGSPSDWRPEGRGFNPRWGRQHSFVEIDHEIFSTVILSLQLIQEG